MLDDKLYRTCNILRCKKILNYFDIPFHFSLNERRIKLLEKEDIPRIYHDVYSFFTNVITKVNIL